MDFRGRPAGPGGKSADDAVPHLAARRLRRGPNQHVHGVDRRAVQDGSLRVVAHSVANFSRANAGRAGAAVMDGGGDDCLFGDGGAGAKGFEARCRPISSISHLGYCLLGVFAAAQLAGPGAEWTTEKAAVLNGVVLQMFNHGITAASLFYFVGLIEQRAGGARLIADFGGLRKAAPVLAGLMGITVFASLGLPGLNGFVGEFLIFKGAFSLAGWAAAAAALGLLATAIFFLTLMQRVFHGPMPLRWDGWNDLTTGERWTAAPAIVLMFVLGIFPQLIIGVCNPAVLQLISQLKA